MAHDSIDQLARRLADALPQGIRNMRDDMEQNFRGILQSGIARLDLVTREEFEVQQSVLARTREKLEGLEARLAALQEPAAPEKPAAKKSKAKKKATKKSTAKSSPTQKKPAKKKPAKKKTAKKKPAKKKAAKTSKKTSR